MDKNSRKNLSAQYKNRTVDGGVYCIKCAKTDQIWLHKTTDMQGSQNRFSFSVATKTCLEPSMLDAWNQYGTDAFTFEVLETLTKKESQAIEEFSDDISVLFGMWQEKLKLT